MVDSVRQGKFHIYAVNTVDEGIEVLTGLRAGRKKKDGTYTEGSINYLVDKRLQEMAKKLKRFAGPAKENKNPGKKLTNTRKKS